MGVLPSEYEEYVNKPCPECGANLLTQKDYDTVLKMQGIFSKLNKGFNLLPKGVRRMITRKDGKESIVPIEMDGSGKMDVKAEDARDRDVR